MSFRLGLCGLVVAVIAAGGLYVMKDRVNRLEGELRRHRALVVAEQTKLHRLRAEWAMLNQPSRIARLAEQHLDLRPAQPTQMVAIADLPRRADLDLEAWQRQALLPSGAEVALRLKPRRPASFDNLAKVLRREP